MGTRLVNRTERLAEIEQLLLRHRAGLRAVEIAEACGVDRRTVYRDLSLLNDIGVPVHQRDGRFYLNRERYAATVRLNLNELTAVLNAARALTLRSEPQNPHVASALNKLRKALPESIALHVAYVVDLLRGHSIDRAFVDVLETITRGWAEQLRVKVWYRDGAEGAPVAREFATYFVEPSRSGALYMIGFDYRTQRINALRLQRVVRVHLLQASYTIPANLDRRLLPARTERTPAEAEQGTEVVLAFTADVVPVIRQQTGRIGQRMQIMDDQRGILRLQIADWHEILPWVRSWGGQVEVLKPTALREQIANDAVQVAAVYQTGL